LRNRRLKIAQLDDLNDPFELKSVNLCNPAHSLAFDGTETHEGFKAEMARRYGVLCFSEDKTDVLQWAHYADRHRGICLGFDVSGVSYADATIMRRVRTSGKLDPVKLGEAYGTVRERLKDSERKTLAKRCSEKDSDKATYYMDVLRAESCRLSLT